MIPITVAINLLMSRMVEVAWPISWISRALLYRTSLSSKFSSAALLLILDHVNQSPLFKPLRVIGAAENQDGGPHGQKNP